MPTLNRRHFGQAFLLCALLPGVCALAGSAQPPAAPPASTSRRPLSLREIADEIRWNVDERGPLLLVDAPLETRQQQVMWRTPAPSLPPPTDRGLALPLVEDYFERRAVRCGSVSTLAPRTMTVLNYKNLPKLTPASVVRPQDRFGFLMATLTPAQWARIGSEQGLGAGDLNRQQRELWDGMLPPQIALTRHREAGVERVEVTPGLRQQMRLRFARRVSWLFQRGVGRDSSFAGTWMPDPSDIWQIAASGPEAERDWQRRTVGAVELRADVAERLKPSDLDFGAEALDATISLGGAQTVGDLVARIRDATRLDLYCDPRYRVLAVSVRGDRARAGDVLKALCRSVTGTVRNLGGQGGAWIMTDDRTGLGTRQAIIGDWVQQRSALLTQISLQLQDALRNADPGKYLTYDAADPQVPDKQTAEQIAAHAEKLRTSPPTYDAVANNSPGVLLWVPVSQLPPSAQISLKEQIAQIQKDSNGSDRPLRTDRVTPRVESSCFLIFPSVGRAKVYSAPSLSPYFREQDPSDVKYAPYKWEPKPLPTRIKTRALMVLTSGASNARALAVSARRAGFTELWIDYDSKSDKATVATLAAAVQEAKAQNLVPRVIVRPLRGKAKDGDALTWERNLQGETWSQ